MLSLFANDLARPVPTFVLTRSWNSTLPSFLSFPAHSSSSSVSLPCTLQTAGLDALTLWSVPLVLSLTCSACFPWLAAHPRLFGFSSIDENKFLGGLACWQHSSFFLFQTVITLTCLPLIGEACFSSQLLLIQLGEWCAWHVIKHGPSYVSVRK